jgi:hypothetical protein
VPKLEKSPKIFHKNRVVFYAILEKTPKIKEQNTLSQVHIKRSHDHENASTDRRNAPNYRKKQKCSNFYKKISIFFDFPEKT